MAEMNDKVAEEWKNRLEALRFISETHRAVRNQRRTTQLQVFFTSATFYALIGAAKFTGKLQIPPVHPRLFIAGAWFLIIAVATLSTVYLLGLNASNRVNRKLAENAEREIMRMVSLPNAEGAGKTIAKTYFWEIAMIVILASAVGISLTFF
jgi:hypothetical protein